MELPSRSTHDDDAAGALALLVSHHRDELTSYLGDPPDPSNVPPAFWNEVQRDTEDELAAILLLMFIASAEHHGAPVGAYQTSVAGSLWSSVNAINISAVYTQTSIDLFTRYGNDWQGRMLSGERLTAASIAEDTTRIFGPNRAARLAVDAVTAAQTAGGEWSVAEFFGLSPDDLWINQPHLSASGPCVICEGLHMLPRSEWELDYPMGPPGPHVGCVCVIQYQHAEVAALN